MEFPITFNNQDEYDESVKKRLAREWDKAQRAAGVEDLKAENAELKRTILERDAREVLTQFNVTDEARQERIIRLAGIDEADEDLDPPDHATLEQRFRDLHKDMPEVFGSDATVVETAADTSHRDRSEDVIVSREQVESMSPQEINSRWDAVKSFLAGERG